MSKWEWLTKPTQPYTNRFLARVLLKAALIFALANVLFALLNPLPFLGGLSLYNGLLPARTRLPYGEDAAQSYNLNLMSLDAMFASHVVACPKPVDDFRVLLIGDSAVWGILLRPEETLTGVLNAENLLASDGRRMRFYNLAHPVLALSKDLLLLDYGMRYAPDLVVWMFTAQSFPIEQQFYPPLVQHNAETMRRLIADYQLNIDPQDERFVNPSFAQRTLLGSRRQLADLFRLQLYGFLWAATGIDQDYPATYTPRATDLEDNLAWYGWNGPRSLTDEDLAIDILAAGGARAGNLPLLLVNEPIFISAGQNSAVRYNAWYPRWAYDNYRALLAQTTEARQWTLIDAWDLIAPAEFTDSPVHLTPAGVQQFANFLIPEIIRLTASP